MFPPIAATTHRTGTHAVTMGDLMQKLDDKKSEFEAWVKTQPPAVRPRPVTRASTTKRSLPKTCCARRRRQGQGKRVSDRKRRASVPRPP